jgi:hypothetical protein
MRQRISGSRALQLAGHVDDCSVTILHASESGFRVRLLLPATPGAGAVFTRLPVAEEVIGLTAAALLEMLQWVPELRLAGTLESTNIFPTARGQSPLPKEEIVRTHDATVALLSMFAEEVGREVDRTRLTEELGRFSTQVDLI